MSNKKKAIRELFRDAVFKRDGHKCRFCSITENLDAHHIIDRTLMANGGYVKENGITLCPQHHLHAEIWHSSGGTDSVEGMTPTDLFKKIYGTYELAVEASLKLGSRL